MLDKVIDISEITNIPLSNTASVTFVPRKSRIFSENKTIYFHFFCKLRKEVINLVFQIRTKEPVLKILFEEYVFSNNPLFKDVHATFTTAPYKLI